MNKAQWARVKELFGTALEIEPSRREAFLRDACGTDEALHAEVVSLLAAHDQSDLLSENPWQARFPSNTPAPKSIGPYQLVRKLGEGGMGQVWLAEQSAPVRRLVALKLVRAGMFDDSLLQRFQSERQSLAMMDHPAIAKVFEAGSTAEGQPYLVMEYVPGLPITEYCDEKTLPIRERLELFMKACDGVQHAHQKAIIHRDLKPANILVVEVDGKPVPRIIDFGLAKAVAPVGENTALLTQAGGFLGTPGYMSPEQADLESTDVDTRTDVYSLGVLLYVLLTGSLPFDPKKKPVLEILRQIREEDPPRASTHFSKQNEISTGVASLRGTDPAQLASLLHGDLDWIAMKALEKDRDRRYGTPSELAADVRRYLDHEPITARPASAEYKLRKYVQRHRLGVATAAGLVLLLTGVAVMQATQLRRITRERDRADRVTQFMTGMFKVSDPSEARGNSITAREILDKASVDIDAGLRKDPELQAQMTAMMARVYEDLGLYSRAESLMRRSTETRTALFGPKSPATLRSQESVAWILSREGHYAEAEKLQRATLTDLRRVLGPEASETARAMTHLGSIVGYSGHHDEAENFHRAALTIQSRTLGPEDPETLTTLHNLAATLDGKGRYREAEEIQRRVLEIRRRVLGAENPDTLLTLSSLGWTLNAEGRYDEAALVQQQTVDLRRKILGPEHPFTVKSMGSLALNLRSMRRYAEAETLQREVLAIQRKVVGPEHPDTSATMNELAWTLDMEGRYPAAEKLQREALEIQRRVLGPEHPLTLKSMDNLTGSLQWQGRFAEAEKLDLAVLEIRRRVLGPENPNTAITLYNLGCITARSGKRSEALKYLLDAIDHGLDATTAKGLEQDPDLKSLHDDPRFVALIVHVQERAVSRKTP